MPEVNRKKVRAMASELAQAPEGEILERFKSSMTTSEFEALQRVCRDRGIAVPAEHGEITPEPDLPQRIISAEELAGVDVAQVKKATSFGWSEGISLLAGVHGNRPLEGRHLDCAFLRRRDGGCSLPGAPLRP